jgi:hypothetical protein
MVKNIPRIKSNMAQKAQMAQTIAGRNTKKISPANREKSRNWAFTLNNHMEAEIENLRNSGTSYIFQEETGKEGTPHLQGTLILKNPQALSYLKKINGRAHWEVCRNKFASVNYCQKGETRTGKLYTNMDIPDLKDKIGTAQIDEKKSIEEILEIEKEKNYIQMLYDLENPDSELYKDIKKLNIPQGQWRNE